MNGIKLIKKKRKTEAGENRSPHKRSRRIHFGTKNCIPHHRKEEKQVNGVGLKPASYERW
jgi:hypothetical protein